MTLEHRYVLALKDIGIIIFECTRKECRSRLSLTPDRLQDPNVLFECPSCKQYWLSGSTRGDNVHNSPQLALLSVLRAAMLADQDDDAGVRIFFEVDAPTS